MEYYRRLPEPHILVPTETEEAIAYIKQELESLPEMDKLDLIEWFFSGGWTKVQV